MKNSRLKINRREFVKLSAASTAVLAVGCIPNSNGSVKAVNLLQAGDPGIRLNPYIFIDTDGKITLYNHRPEMGQGTYQSIPTIIAEELEVDIDQVEIAQSPADRAQYGSQMVVGSQSIPSQFEPLRVLGAAAREMLIRAAARTWQVKPKTCRASAGTVVHEESGKTFKYMELIETASQLNPPDAPKLKDPADFKLIGNSIARRDIPRKTNGTAVFGIDEKVPGMLYASVERSWPTLGKIINIDGEAAMTIPGVKAILKTQRNCWGHTIEGVAVVAENYWAAERGRKALTVTTESKGESGISSEIIATQYRQATAEAGEVFYDKGNIKQANDAYSKKVEAVYETPFQAHAPMEPINCIVYAQEDQAEFWGSTQNPNGIRAQLAKQLSIPESKVKINYTFMGGGFGRRSMTDMAEEAAHLSKQVNAPVKVIWSREDDITQGPFRACQVNSCRGALNQKGEVMALEHKVVAQGIQHQVGDSERARRQIVGGIQTAYEVPNFQVIGVPQKLPIPISYWRAVYHSTNTFAHESFIDELAHAAGKDPLEFRLSLLQKNDRFKRVLELVADKSNWSTKAAGVGKGVAIVERSGAHVAMVVEVQNIGGNIAPVKITCAVDLGIAVNPDTVKAQMEGSVVMGLTAAVKSSITIDRGLPIESNFDTYRMLKLGECPEVETHIVPSTNAPDGAGEGGLPTVAPALTNAIFDLTGERIRKLPFDLKTIS